MMRKTIFIAIKSGETRVLKFRLSPEIFTQKKTKFNRDV